MEEFMKIRDNSKLATGRSGARAGDSTTCLFQWAAFPERRRFGQIRDRARRLLFQLFSAGCASEFQPSRCVVSVFVFDTKAVKSKIGRMMSQRNLGKLLAGFWLGIWVAGSVGWASDAFDPPALYLTWQRDPTTTMTVHWHTEDEAKTELYFRRVGDTNAWTTAAGTSHPLPASIRTVHTVELTGLRPKTDYEFCFWPGERVFKFRTLPKDLSQPIRFADGGDVYHHREAMDTMNELVGKLDASFAVIGGDLAYAFGGSIQNELMERWDAYFDSWKQKARTPDGRLVPMLVTIGNHEVRGSYHQPSERAPAYYASFAMPGPQGYNVLDCGNYLSLLLLDSGHTHPVEGAQTDWLKQTLAARQHVSHVFPVYHVPAWPSYRSDKVGESGKINHLIREHWCPLFDEYGVQLAFEHHDHAYKRTYPIRKGSIDPRGVVYLGDGAWGVTVRKPDAKGRWYLARAGQIRHIYLVTLYADARHVVAVNENGEFFDEVYQRVR